MDKAEENLPNKIGNFVQNFSKGAVFKIAFSSKIVGAEGIIA